MDIERFKELMISSPGQLVQSAPEWQHFLEFSDGYFKSRGIEHPVVVEIGIMFNAQKQFYQELIGAEHIGLDANPGTNPDILGDSHSPVTVAALEERLAGRQIDLLFIDGDHSYAGVKRDYEIYQPLTKHLIALHDIFGVQSVPDEIVDVMRFWHELMAGNGQDTLMTFRNFNSFRHMGIGLVIKEKERE